MPISASFRGRNSAIQFLRPYQPSSRPSQWASHRGVHTRRWDRNGESDQASQAEGLFDETNLASFADELTALVDDTTQTFTNGDIGEDGKTPFQRQSGLPKSPLMDPAFIAAQKKHSQPKALGSTSRLRRNPYAQALATPIRICQITRMPLPSFFLQGFKVAAESENEQPYFVPQGTLLKTLHSKRFISQKGLQYSMMRDLDNVLKPDMDTNGETTAEETDSDNGASKKEGEDAEEKVDEKSLGMFGSNTYILARSSMLSGMHGTVLSRLIPTRIGQSKHAQSYRKALYRSDMDRHVLYMVRRSVYYWLLNLHGIGKGYISPYDDFEKAKRYGLKSGLFLWTKDHDRNSDVSPPEFATILTEPKQSRPRKIPVHNLEFLLGETMMSKLREATKDTHKDTFARPILGIKNRNMTVGLELRLWWLQCYLAKHNKILK